VRILALLFLILKYVSQKMLLKVKYQHQIQNYIIVSDQIIKGNLGEIKSQPNWHAISNNG